MSATLSKTTQYMYSATVYNAGPAAAHDVKVYFDGKPASECHILFDPFDERILATLSPSASVSYKLTPHLGEDGRLPRHVRIERLNAAGDSGEWQGQLA